VFLFFKTKKQSYFKKIEFTNFRNVIFTHALVATAFLSRFSALLVNKSPKAWFCRLFLLFLHSIFRNMKKNRILFIFMSEI